jgi:hypothetical protein
MFLTAFGFQVDDSPKIKKPAKPEKVPLAA